MIRYEQKLCVTAACDGIEDQLWKIGSQLNLPSSTEIWCDTKLIFTSSHQNLPILTTLILKRNTESEMDVASNLKRCSK